MAGQKYIEKYAFWRNDTGRALGEPVRKIKDGTICYVSFRLLIYLPLASLFIRRRGNAGIYCSGKYYNPTYDRSDWRHLGEEQERKDTSVYGLNRKYYIWRLRADRFLTIYEQNVRHCRRKNTGDYQNHQIPWRKRYPNQQSRRNKHNRYKRLLPKNNF